MVDTKIAAIAASVVLIAVVGMFLFPGTGMATMYGSIAGFQDQGGNLELEDGKPVIRMFSTTRCPHCHWVGSGFEEVAREYEGRIVAKHWEIDIGDDTLTSGYEGGVPQSEIDIFRKANPRGSVPAFIFAGKYVRTGTLHEFEDDLEAEKDEFRAMIDAILEKTEA